MSYPSVKLGDVCEVLSGYAWTAAKFNTDGIGMPVIRIQNVASVMDCEFVHWDETYDERFVIRAGDIVLTLSGSFRVEAWRGPDALLNQRIVKLTPSPALDKRWFLNVLQTRLSEIENLGRHALVNNVSINDVKNLEIPAPSLPEQRRIAAILDQADALRGKRRETLAQLSELKKAIFIGMFGDPQAHIDSGNTEELANIVAPGKIVTYGIVQAGPEVENGVPYIRTGDIKNGVILEHQLARTSKEIAESYSRSAIATGDIVMSIRATVGTTALVPSSLDGANLTQGTARISPGARVRSLYLLNYLRATPVQRWIQSHVKGATFREITLGKLRQLPVFIPPQELQDSFVEKIKCIEHLASQACASLEELNALFVSLQHRAFRGEL